ncbi:hypothetical protein AB0O01_00575 [Streptomyces sp. NPDC093252]|uniref:hypothetical protein n=1 Tax=Streptomyces sp. NPDC093252 TaxID=3154980 RepID=UPI00342596D9
MRRTSDRSWKSVTAACAASLALGAGGTLAGASTATADGGFGGGGPAVLAAGKPSAADLAAARSAATAPATLETLSRFFARDGAATGEGAVTGEGEGAVGRSAAGPRAEGSTVPVLTLSPDFVAGKPGAAVARTEFLATQAVSADGRRASVWAAPLDGGWQVVNIATGDDEFRYARRGADLLPGGTVFREPQIDAWFVHKGAKVLPLDEDAVRAVGGGGTTLDAYRTRVRAAYGDKLPGSGYAKKGYAGGYSRGGTAQEAGVREGGGGPVNAVPVTAGAGAALALALGGAGAMAAGVRRRRRA